MGSVYAQRVCLHTTGKTVGSVYAFHVNLGVCTRSTGQSLRVCLRSTGQFFGSVCPLRVNLLGSIYAPEVRLWGPSALYRTISGSDCALQVTVGVCLRCGYLRLFSVHLQVYLDWTFMSFATPAPCIVSAGLWLSFALRL